MSQRVDSEKESPFKGMVITPVPLPEYRGLRGDIVAESREMRWIRVIDPVRHYVVRKERLYSMSSLIDKYRRLADDYINKNGRSKSLAADTEPVTRAYNYPPRTDTYYGKDGHILLKEGMLSIFIQSPEQDAKFWIPIASAEEAQGKFEAWVDKHMDKGRLVPRIVNEKAAAEKTEEPSAGDEKVDNNKPAAYGEYKFSEYKGFTGVVSFKKSEYSNMSTIHITLYDAKTNHFHRERTHSTLPNVTKTISDSDLEAFFHKYADQVVEERDSSQNKTPLAAPKTQDDDWDLGSIEVGGVQYSCVIYWDKGKHMMRLLGEPFPDPEEVGDNPRAQFRAMAEKNYSADPYSGHIEVLANDATEPGHDRCSKEPAIVTEVQEEPDPEIELEEEEMEIDEDRTIFVFEGYNEEGEISFYLEIKDEHDRHHKSHLNSILEAVQDLIDSMNKRPSRLTMDVQPATKVKEEK